MTQEISITPIPNGFVATGITLENFVDGIIRKTTKEAWELSKLDVPNPFDTIKIDDAYAAKYRRKGTVQSTRVYMVKRVAELGIKAPVKKQGTYIYKKDEAKFLAEFGIYNTK